MFNETIYCCQMMHDNTEIYCRHHPKGCPNKLITYEVISNCDEREIQAGILIHDGSDSAMFKIKYCPWCGIDLGSLAGPVIGFHLKKSYD